MRQVYYDSETRTLRFPQDNAPAVYDVVKSRRATFSILKQWAHWRFAKDYVEANGETLGLEYVDDRPVL